MNRISVPPETVTDILQVAKSVVAATAAWWLAVGVLGSPVPFLAPWVALSTVYPTVYESFSRGAQATVASWLGVGLSFVVGTFLGVTVWTFALALLAALVFSRIPGIRSEGVGVATTVIFVLGSGFSEQQPVLLDRLLEVAVGAGVGVIVNFLLIPPLRDQQAARYIDSINQHMGDVLTQMADEFRNSWETDEAEAWLTQTESMRAELESAWSSVRSAHQSRRANPRKMLPMPQRPNQRRVSSQQPGHEASYREILDRVDEGISHLRHMTRTLREASYASGEWDTQFREQWSDLVRDTGNAIADPDADVESILDRIDHLAQRMSGQDNLPRSSWPLYGALLTTLRHIVVIVDDVASAREAREPDKANPGV